MDLASTPTLELPAVVEPPERTADRQATLFRDLRFRIARNSLRTAWESGKVKLLSMLGTSLVVAAFVFGLSWYGIAELFAFKVPAKGLIVGGLFDLMFFTLGSMLLISTGIILYASLFTAPEARFLLCSPARADHVFASKFQGAAAFSSWAFLILGMPILVAYGIVAGVPWYFYPLIPLYLLGFVLVPGCLSAMAGLLFVRYAPRNRKQAVAVLILVAVSILTYWLVQFGMAARSTLLTPKKNEVEGLIGQFALVQHPAMPSHWMTNGLMAAARGELGNALTPLALLWSNGLMLYLGATLLAKRIYRKAYDRVAGGGSAKRIYKSSVLDRFMEWSVFYLDKPTRILVVKDFRTFRRDPTQWVLLAIFGGLLLLGASNFRQYYKNDLGVMDKYAVSLVNISATSVLMCAGLSRFIFPLISLEGRKFWILGLMPIRREQILYGKFFFAATISTVLAETLILVGDVLLGLPAGAIAVHAVTVALTAVGLSAINVGLGACLPNFRETDPSKIVVGFGGTMNMMIGLLYIVIAIGIAAVPMHVAGLTNALKNSGGNLPLWAYAGLPPAAMAAAIAVVLPLRAGIRALKSTEF